MSLCRTSLLRSYASDLSPSAAGEAMPLYQIEDVFLRVRIALEASPIPVDDYT
jgi:hypothetical protein